jgi:hypothetical protein
MLDLDMLGCDYVGGPADDAIASGNRDENALTDMEFNARHPERMLLRDPKIKADEKDLAAEWIKLRDSIVRPALAKVKPKESIVSRITSVFTPSPSPAAPAAAAAPAPDLNRFTPEPQGSTNVFAVFLGLVALGGIGIAVLKKGN